MEELWWSNGGHQWCGVGDGVEAAGEASRGGGGGRAAAHRRFCTRQG